ncbi:MAG TPA: hypothetical protein VMY78_06850 [Solirubrobacteraceae bacterium]|nr:hypothetical protein [Solirubrobacteraceae bacterium]
MNSPEAKARLIRLQAERLMAREAGAQEPSPYMTRLSDAIEEARIEYTTSAVLEIACLRSELTAPTVG